MSHVRSSRYPQGGLLRVSAKTDGHLTVTLYKGESRRTRHVHQLVLETFIGSCPPTMEVRHLDGDPKNNYLGNLVCGTRAENQQDAVRHGTHASTRRTHCRRDHPYDEINTYTDPAGRRHCRACSAINEAAYRARQRG
jgi:hypothetical protein